MSSPCNHRSLCLVLHEFVGQWSLNHLNVHMPTQPMQAVTEGPCPHSVTVVRKTGIQPVTLMMGRAEGWGCGQNAARACSQQSHQCSRLCFHRQVLEMSFAPFAAVCRCCLECLWTRCCPVGLVLSLEEAAVFLGFTQQISHIRLRWWNSVPSCIHKLDCVLPFGCNAVSISCFIQNCCGLTSTAWTQLTYESLSYDARLSVTLLLKGSSGSGSEVLVWLL